MMNRRYEQGGVVSFLVVAVVLAGLLAGGIWWAKQSQTTPSTGQNTVSVPGESNISSDGKESSGEGSSAGGSTSSGGTDGSQGSSSTSGSSNSSNSGTSSTTNNVASTGPSSNELPSTGPSDALAIGIVLSVASAGMYYLYQSRQRVRVSALK